MEHLRKDLQIVFQRKIYFISGTQRSCTALLPLTAAFLANKTLEGNTSGCPSVPEQGDSAMKNLLYQVVLACIGYSICQFPTLDLEFQSPSTFWPE